MKKAFIAGAICPSCGKEDKIFVLSDRDSKVMKCASCDYARDMSEEKNADLHENEEDKTVLNSSEKTPQVIKWK